jgi:hypothetical protein
MKLNMKMGGLCASGAFVLVTYTAFFQLIRSVNLVSSSILGSPPAFSPMKFLGIIGLGLLGALIAGSIGYEIGNILSHPKGERMAQKQKSGQEPLGLPEVSSAGEEEQAISISETDESQIVTVTGEETPTL